MEIELKKALLLELFTNTTHTHYRELEKTLINNTMGSCELNTNIINLAIERIENENKLNELNDELSYHGYKIVKI
jgi:hypothetical protein